ncbi:MAG TPA: glycosyltransferase, partial [Thermoanaerobaculia bacterium]|nr:glycosyltransferase [Thermoanaerobaculia bacterium]
MRVAVLAHSFPRFAGDTHGPFVKRLSESLAERGHEVHALVPFDPELAPDPETPLSIHSFRYVWPDRWHLLGYSRTLKRDVGLKLWAYLESPLYFRFAERALARLVQRERIELLHAHWLLPNGYVAARVARRLGLPLAITLHGSDIFMAERNSLFRRMARTTLASASHVTSCSPELAERLLAISGGAHRERVLVVANGTDVVPDESSEEAGRALRRRFGWGEGERLVVAVGRMVDKKGFRDLVAAGERFLARFPQVRLVFGGGGDLQPALEAQARAAGLGGRVSFTGGLSHPDVLALIAAAEIFVMPSIRDVKGNVDGLPIVVLEAMAAGKPVVATDVSGIPLAVEPGKTGLLVPERQPAALAAAVE